METISVKNFRSLRSIPEIYLKPMTILVGQNSSGKSTLARLFPLFKQTFETRTSEPILWYGKYVDFGDYDQCITHGEKGDLGFTFTLSCEIYARRRYFYAPLRIGDENIQKGIRVTISLKKEWTSFLQIEMSGQSIEISFENAEKISSIKINGTLYPSKYIKCYASSSFFPHLECASDKENTNSLPYMGEFNKIAVAKKIQESLMKYTYRGTKKATLLRGILKTSVGSREEIMQSYINNNDFPEGMRDNLSKVPIDSKEFDEINDLTIILNIPEIIHSIMQKLSSEFLNVRYSKPLRATAERYYRIQGLAVDEVDPSGENLAMVLHNLNSSEKRKFCEWTNRTFGCEFSTISKEGHVSIVVRDKSTKTEDNLADTGFGYSQILPILLSVWKATLSTSKSSTTSRIFFTSPDNFYEVIEQPELHLHPAFQAKLIDSFVQLIEMNKTKDIKFILETHSETIINRIGYSIYNGKIPSEKVNIVIFNKSETGETNIKQVEFNHLGQLEDWPIGFFDPDNL